MTPQHISDRLEIQDVLVRYCHAVDRKQWDILQTLFTDDATVDYSAFGGPKGPAGELPGYFIDVLANVRSTQHTISTSLIDLTEDHAVVRSAAQVMMISDAPNNTDHVLFVGLWYRDSLVKVADGWKLRERVQEYSWVHNVQSAHNG